MTPEQIVALIVALTGLMAAIGVVIRQLGELRKDLNGRLEQLLVATSEASRKQGELAGRDYVHAAVQAKAGPPIAGQPPER